MAILTLNHRPKNLILIGAKLIDTAGGIILLPFALVANVVRGIVGVIIYPP